MEGKKQLKKIFGEVNADRSGFITKEEFSTAMKKLDISLRQEEIEKMFKHTGHDQNGLSFKDFVIRATDAKLATIFNELDTDSSGAIVVSELHQAFVQLGYTEMSKKDTETLLLKVDTNVDGSVSLSEFCDFFRLVPMANLENIVKQWAGDVTIDCGTDLSPPITSQDVPWYYGVCGGIGGCVSRTLTAPLERIKIIAQTRSTPMTSMFTELQAIVRQGGMCSLFAGNAANCTRVFPYAGIVTLIYLNGLKLTPADAEFDRYEPLYRGSVAATAGVIGQLSTYPLDVIRARISVNPEQYHGMRHCATSLLKEGDIHALYRGLRPTLFAVVPFLAIQYATADTLKLLAGEREIEVTPMVMLAMGGTAGLVAQSVIYPLDLLRRRRQMMGGTVTTTTNANVVADKTWMALRQVIKEDGARSLFRGLAPTYAKVFPSVAIAMATTKTLIDLCKTYID